MPEATEPTRIQITVDVPQVIAWGETPESMAAKLIVNSHPLYSSFEIKIVKAEWVPKEGGK